MSIGNLITIKYTNVMSIYVSPAGLPCAGLHNVHYLGLWHAFHYGDMSFECVSCL